MSAAWKRPTRLVGLATAGLVSYQCTLVFLDHRRQRISQIVPSVPVAQDVSAVSVRSPVPVLDHAAANAKLRQEARTFHFDSHGGAKGRVDLMRLPSNNPVEDEWALAVGQGIGGEKGTLYAGVYDGHA